MPTFEIVPVIEARAVGDAHLWLRFRDGLEGTIDLSHEIKQAPFAELSDPTYFSLVEIIGSGVGWPNGWDCAPEWLYDRVSAAVGHGERQKDDDWRALQEHARRMPEISRFFGIVIKMFFSDHVRPHFHAEHGEHVISIEIDGDGVRGSFPPSRLPMLFEWRDKHRAELRANWERLRNNQPAEPIEPLA